MKKPKCDYKDFEVDIEDIENEVEDLDLSSGPRFKSPSETKAVYSSSIRDFYNGLDDALIDEQYESSEGKTKFGGLKRRQLISLRELAFELRKNINEAGYPITVEHASGETHSSSSKKNPLENSLGDIVELENGIIKGQTHLYRNIAWASSMVHSSDLMVPTSILLKELLDQEDEVDRVDAFRISSLIKREMTVYGKRNGQLREVLNMEADPPSFTIEFKTKKGDNVVVAGYQTGSDLPVRNVGNNILNEMTMNFSEYRIVNDEIIFPIKPAIFGYQGEKLNFKMPLAFRLATSSDLAIMAISIAGEKIISKELVDNGYTLAAGFENLKVPALADLLQGGHLIVKKPDPSKIKVTKSGYVIVPINFEFKSIDGRIVGGGTYNRALPKTGEAGQKQWLSK